DGLRLGPSLDDALRYLPPEDALALFEREDLRRLADRKAVADYLDYHLSFYTTEEMADLADAFADHLEDNRPHLEATGLPRTSFSMRWPGPFLRDLYPVKAFNGCETKYYVDGREIPLTFPLLYGRDPDTSVSRIRCYTWKRPPDPTPGAEEGPGSIAPEASWDDAGWVPCTYDEAPVTHGLDRSDAARLEAGRPAMLDLEIRVLRRLASALRARDATHLWSDCLRLLTDALLADDAAFYLRIDRFLNSYDLRTGETSGEGDPDFAPGGLTNLLEMIGDCEKELTIGTMDRTKRALPPEGAPDSLRSYYEAIGQSWQARFDRALDLFVELEAREAAFRDGFRARVNAALENEFFAEVVVRTRVKQKLVAMFEPQVRTFAEWQRAHLEATGSLPALSLSDPAGAPVPQRNVFRREGETWTLAFGGHTTHPKDRKGLRYLAHLLGRPGEKVHVLDLVRAIEGGTAASGSLGGVTGADLAQQGLLAAGFGDAGPRLDDETKTRFGNRLRELGEQRELAVELGNVDDLDRIEGEVEAIDRALRAGFDIRGRPRRDASAAERARTNVKKLIEDARKQIAASHPILALHLQCLSTGTYCAYDPGPDDPRWEL
ncbi:MAG: hypothetical protein M3Q10_04830, partial [Chloroflexota bacterium]|nr:hypothetical protein [Chloroflexota bacterium]